MREVQAFDIDINPFSADEFISIAKLAIIDNNQIVQIGINSASVNLLFSNEDFRNAIKTADLVNVDGVSVLLALRFLGYNIPERVATPDLADGILAMAEKEGFSVFLFGAAEDSLSSCLKILKIKLPELKIAGSRNGYFDKNEEQMVVDLINNSNPDILFIAMPSPQKEFFFANHRKKLKAKYILGVGGYFDVLAGIVKRAPLWVQKIGMEWFYRFIQEPGRLWRRYLFGNARFFFLAFKEKFHFK